MKKSAHQIWKESKEQNLTKEEFKEKLKSEGVIIAIKQNNTDFNYKNEKVSFWIHCQCGCRIMNDELIKKFDKYYCPKCNRLITSINPLI
jgi:hypothetical protein